MTRREKLELAAQLWSAYNEPVEIGWTERWDKGVAQVIPRALRVVTSTGSGLLFRFNPRTKRIEASCSDNDDWTTTQLTAEDYREIALLPSQPFQER